MHIEINDNTALREIQQTFSDFYPWLQIEFYNKAHKKYEGSEIANQLHADNSVGEVKQTHVSGLLEIRPSYKVADVEKEFQDRFGLSVQIMMKEKGQWVQTTGTDILTLKDINQLSRNASDEYILSELEAEEHEEES
ncbi:MAG: hypothetical protein JNN00_19170 [Chitinophagaceae bacterium]|nr:hypothetical protein [Chitinophagaceae bacterium]